MSHETTLVDLIRHGEPEGGPMFRGHTDHPLSPEGWQQMQGAIQPDDRWDAIVTSPLSRCRAFADRLGDEQGLPVYREPRFQEIDFGDWEGLSTETVMAKDGDALRAFWANPVDHPPPGGERLPAFQARVQEAWQHWLATLTGQRWLLVCHGGVIRMVLADVLSMPLPASFSTIEVPYACRSRIRIDRSDFGNHVCLQSHGPQRS